MSVRIENISREIIEWAIVRNGNNLQDFYAENPKVESWANGEKNPTVKQLEDFTHKVHVPFGYMFLRTPPEEDITLPFFRTALRGNENKVSLNVFHAIKIIQDRQNWLTEYLEDLNFPDLEFIGKFNDNNTYKEIVADIRSVLKLTPNWASKFDNWENALDFLTNQIEDAGIIITFNGIVGSNTKRVINVNECRGFVLVNKKAPFLFINSSDAKAAQMFTLIHELAHVWLNKSAGFDNQSLLPANDPTEILCDKVAAEFLVPELLFKDKWKENNSFVYLSRIFKVSQIVIARRALDLGMINKDAFFAFYTQFMSDFLLSRNRRSSGGNFYAVAKKRISLRFATFVNNAVNDNKLLFRDAYKLTNLKGDSYKKFITEYLY